MSDKPKLAYDVRRYMLLVQLLAQDDELMLKASLHSIAIKWGVYDYINWHETTALEVIQAMAKHIIEYHKSD